MTRAPEHAWTPEHDATLRRLAVDEKASAAVTATALGRSTFAVAARARRIGVTFAHTFWAPAKIDQLRAMAAEGRNAIEIAEAVGSRRGPVCDKASRLKIKIVRSAPASRPPPPTRAAKAFRFGPSNAGDPTAPQDIRTTGPTPRSLNVRMWDERFTGHCCRWATKEDAGGHFFCAAPALPDMPYCDAHDAAAYRPAPPRPPSAVKDSAPRAAKADDGEPKPLDFERAA